MKYGRVYSIFFLEMKFISNPRVKKPDTKRKTTTKTKPET